MAPTCAKCLFSVRPQLRIDGSDSLLVEVFPGAIDYTRAEDDQGTPTQSHISPSILVYEDKMTDECAWQWLQSLIFGMFSGKESPKRVSGLLPESRG